MKKLLKILPIFICCLCLCCECLYIVTSKLDPFVKTIQIAKAKEIDNAKKASDSDNLKNNESIEQTVENWATAYCNRNGNTLYQLFDPDNKNKFFQVNNVNSTKGDLEIRFGVSSPWPWETDFDIYIEGDTARITYYAMTSEPHVRIWIENLNLVKKDGLYYVSSEEMKEYDSVTTKGELAESINGNFGYYANKLNYINSGLSYTLNQNASKNKTGVYTDLFSAETAAPYLLNLSGGKCIVKKKYLTCTIVTYLFRNGDSADILMTQLFGKKGIWLVEDVDVNGDENIENIERWYQKLNIKTLNKIKTVVNTNEIVEADKGSTLLLASIPKEKVYLYGYARGNAVILRINNKYQLFRWGYTSPRGILPRIGYTDFDQDGKKEIAVSMCTGTGTGVSVDQLYLVKTKKDGTMSAMEFTKTQYIKQLKERILAKYSQTEGMLQFYIDNKKAGKAIDISSWIKEGYQYSGIGFGDQISFEITKKAITLNCIPGCYFKNIFPAQYDGIPIFTAKIEYKKGEFSLTNIK